MNFYQNIKTKLCSTAPKKKYFNTNENLTHHGIIQLRGYFYRNAIIFILDLIQNKHSNLKNIFRLNGDSKKILQILEHLEKCKESYMNEVEAKCRENDIIYSDKKDFLEIVNVKKFLILNDKLFSGHELANSITKIIKQEFNGIFEYKKTKKIYNYVIKARKNGHFLSIQELYNKFTFCLKNISGENQKIMKKLLQTFLIIEEETKINIKSILLSVMGIFLPSKFVNEPEYETYFIFFRKKQDTLIIIKKKYDIFLGFVLMMSRSLDVL